MIALNLNDALAHRPPRSAALLELGRQRLDIRDRQWQSADGGNTLARPALDLASHTHGRRFGRTRNALGADALANRPAAVRAETADARGINDTRIHFVILMHRRSAPLAPWRREAPQGGVYA